MKHHKHHPRLPSVYQEVVLLYDIRASSMIGEQSAFTLICMLLPCGEWRVECNRRRLQRRLESCFAPASHLPDPKLGVKVSAATRDNQAVPISILSYRDKGNRCQRFIAHLSHYSPNHILVVPYFARLRNKMKLLSVLVAALPLAAAALGGKKTIRELEKVWHPA